jgi:hypothetical protein
MMADPERLDTVIDSVTVFNRAALVCRTGRLPDLAGKTQVEFIVHELPLSLDAGSIRVSVIDSTGWKESDGSAQQVSKRIRMVHRSGWTVRNIALEIDRAGPEELSDEEELSEKIARLEKELDELSFDLSCVSARLEEVARWMASPIEASSRDDESESRPDLFPYAAWEAFVRICCGHLDALHTRERDLNSRCSAAAQELAITRELQAARRLRSPDEIRYCRNLKVSLSRLGESAHQPESLEISYAVPGAQWKPVYKLYLSDDFSKAKLVMGAQVAQRSGEDWPDVALRFSAASFHRITQLPELPSRRIGRAQPPRPKSYRDKLPPSESLFSAYDHWRRSQGAVPAPVPMTLNTLFDECDRKLGGLMNEYSAPVFQPKGTMLFGKAPVSPPLPPMSSAPAIPLPPPPPVSVAPEPLINPYIPCELSDLIEPEMEFMSAPEPMMKASPPAQAPVPAAMPAKRRVQDMMKKADAPAKMNLESCFRKGIEQLKETVVMRSAGPGGAGRLEEAQMQTAASKDGWLSDGDFEGTASLIVLGGAEPGADAGAAQDYFSYELDGPEASEQLRGRLRKTSAIPVSPRVREQIVEVVKRVYDAIRTAEVYLISDSELPGFQCVYEAECRAHVPGDGLPHTVNILIGLSESAMHFRTVPMTDSKVFRRLMLRNPFPFPIPGGEVQTFLDNAYLLTTPFKGTGINGEVMFPLGVEQRLRVARNTTFAQDEKGIVGENSLASHTVSIQVRSHMPKPVTVEIVERVPIREESEKKIDIKVTASEPKSEQVEFIDNVRVRGAHRWSLEVKPGEEVSAHLEYRISIPSKMEIVGGNRRV